MHSLDAGAVTKPSSFISYVGISMHISAAAALSSVPSLVVLLDVCSVLHAASTGAIWASNMVWFVGLPHRALLHFYLVVSCMHVDDQAEYTDDEFVCLTRMLCNILAKCAKYKCFSMVSYFLF